jgi:hypothetical protein
MLQRWTLQYNYEANLPPSVDAEGRICFYNFMKKRRHHYVWKHYLAAWAIDESIWCCRNNNVFKTNLINVAQTRDFYKLKELNKADVDAIKMIAIDGSPPHLQKLNAKWITLFNWLFEFRRVCTEKHLNNTEVDARIEEAIQNFEEDLHARFENNSVAYLTALLEEDTSFFKTEQGCMFFMHYLCVQYMSTNRIKTNVLALTPRVQLINYEKIWNVLSHIFATK